MFSCGSFFKLNIADVLYFSWIKCFCKGLSKLKNRVKGDNYCWNYRQSKLLLPFIEYCLDQLNNNKHTKTTVNTKCRSCKIYAKLNGNHLLMANIFKLHEYQTFSLMKMHNMSKIWFANNKFSWRKSLVYD